MRPAVSAAILSVALLGACAAGGKGDPEDTDLALDDLADSARVRLVYHGDADLDRVHAAELTSDARRHAWTFALPWSAHVEIATLAAGDTETDTVLALYRHHRGGWGHPLQVNDDAGDDTLLSALAADLDGGEYLVVVSGYARQTTGPFGLRLRCGGAACTAALEADLEAALDSAHPDGAAFFTMPASGDLARIPQDPKNPLRPAKVALGQLLYHETALAVTGKRAEGRETYSCASCHHAAAGFQAGLPQGLSEGGRGAGAGRTRWDVYSPEEMDLQPIRSPSAMNLAWQEAVLWNGQFGATGVNAGTEAGWTAGTPKEVNHLGYQGLESQAIAGQGVHRLECKGSRVDVDPAYQALFAAAFADLPEEQRTTREMVGLAIAAYERTLIASEAPFQRWLRGDGALAPAELRGALVFFGRGGCVACHTGPALASMTFHALGMDDLGGPGILGPAPDDATRRGRGGFTGRAEDDHRFKTPQLYNLADSPFYGHGSSFRSLRAVVDYLDRAVPQRAELTAAQLSPRFQPLGLSADEREDLTRFLETALHDPDLARFVPTELPSGNCTPWNDPEARAALGCD